MGEIQNKNASSGKIPLHVAIIMDGNGRWAKNRGLTRIEGHRVGMNKIWDVVNWCKERSINILTLYAFSKQNWNRPRAEVDFLMKTFELYLEKEVSNLMKDEVMLQVIGRVNELSFNLREKIEKVTLMTRANKKFFLNLAINYGGQEEIVDAARSISILTKKGEILPEDIDVELFRKHLYAPDIVYPDLIIRSGGDFRVSNFLLWEIAYAEFWITSTFWPDFNQEHLDAALHDFAQRQRRYGAIQGD